MQASACFQKLPGSGRSATMQSQVLKGVHKCGLGQDSQFSCSGIHSGFRQNHLKACPAKPGLIRTARSLLFLNTNMHPKVGSLALISVPKKKRCGTFPENRKSSVRQDRYKGHKRWTGRTCCVRAQQKSEDRRAPRLSLVARFLTLFSGIKGPGGSRKESGGTKEGFEGPYEIQLQDVTRVYGKRTVVDGVNLRVKQGEVVGLLGPNGAGKSTTFNITVGRERPSHGCVLLNGHDITSLPLDARARLGVGYLTQEPSVFRGLSVRDNLLLILQETGVPRVAQGPRIDQLLKEFRLTHVQHTMGGALSGGERRRTELARALASNCSGGPPKILLVDEPFAGVDPIGVAEIQGLLRKLCDELHMGILITDHNVTETLKICNRAYMVFQGQVMAQGAPQELVQNPFVRQYYLGEGYKHPDLSSNSGGGSPVLKKTIPLLDDGNVLQR